MLRARAYPRVLDEKMTISVSIHSKLLEQEQGGGGTNDRDYQGLN